MDQPLLCGDGRCVKFEHQCFSTECPLDSPFLCPDMRCETFLYNCRETMASRPFKDIKVLYNFGSSLSKVGIEIDGIEEGPGSQKVLFTAVSTFEIFYPPKRSPYLSRLSGGKSFAENCTLEIKPISSSQTQKTTNNVSRMYTVSIDSKIQMKNMTIPSYFTVRSPVLNVSTTGRFDNNELFAKPMRVRFGYNPVKLDGVAPNIDTVHVASCHSTEVHLPRDDHRVRKNQRNLVLREHQNRQTHRPRCHPEQPGLLLGRVRNSWTRNLRYRVSPANGRERLV